MPTYDQKVVDGVEGWLPPEEPRTGVILPLWVSLTEFGKLGIERGGPVLVSDVLVGGCAVTKKSVEQTLLRFGVQLLEPLFHFALFKELVHRLLCSGLREGEVSEKQKKRERVRVRGVRE